MDEKDKKLIKEILFGLLGINESKEFDPKDMDSIKEDMDSIKRMVRKLFEENHATNHKD